MTNAERGWQVPPLFCNYFEFQFDIQGFFFFFFISWSGGIGYTLSLIAIAGRRNETSQTHHWLTDWPQLLLIRLSVMSQRSKDSFLEKKEKKNPSCLSPRRHGVCSLQGVGHEAEELLADENMNTSEHTHTHTHMQKYTHAYKHIHATSLTKCSLILPSCVCVTTRPRASHRPIRRVCQRVC